MIRKLIRLLTVLAVLAGISAWFWTEYKKHGEIKSLLKKTVRAQKAFAKEMGVYALDWQVLPGVGERAVSGRIYCMGGANKAGQTSCADEQTRFEITLHGQTDIKKPAFVMAVRKNDKLHGEYKLIQFYNDKISRTFCIPGTRAGRTICRGFADGSGLDLTTFEPPALPCKKYPCVKPCPTDSKQRCRIYYYANGRWTENYGYSGLADGVLLEYTARGVIRKVKYCSKSTPAGVCNQGTEDIYNAKGQKTGQAFCAVAYKENGRCVQYGKRSGGPSVPKIISIGS